MKHIPIILTILFFLVACNQNKTTKETLSKIDSLILAEKVDSAKTLAIEVDSSRLNVHDRSVYHLFSIIIRYKEHRNIADTTCLDECIKVFKQYGDKRDLCRSYLYKSYILIAHKEYMKALHHLKIAEGIVKNVDDTDTEQRVYSALVYLNTLSANYHTAITYTEKALNQAYNENNKRWVAYFLDAKGVTFDHLGNKDSSAYYELSAIPYLTYLPQREQSYVMNNIASILSHKEDYDSAEAYIKRSEEIRHSPRGSGILAIIYTKKDEMVMVDSLFKESLNTEDLGIRVLFMTKYSEWLQRQKRYEEATALGLEAKYLRDSLSNIQDTERMKEIQEDYDLLSQTYKHRKKEGLMLVLVAGLLIVSLVLYTCYRKKTVDNRNRMSQMKKRIAEYEVALEKLKAGGKEQELAAKELRRRMDDVKKGMREILVRGKQKFTSLTEEWDTTQHWHKRDYLDAIEYYFMKRPQVMEVIHNNYKHLSATQTLYLLLLDHGLSEDSAAQALNMSNGAMRTMKSRIKKKQDDENVK